MKRWLRRALLAGLCLIVLLVLLVLALGSGPVLGWLSGQRLQGSLWTGLRAQQLAGQADGWRWQLQALQLDPPRWQDGHWQLRLQMQSLQLQGPGSSSTPLSIETLQAQLRRVSQLTPVQLALRIDQLRINALDLDALQAQLQSNAQGLQLHQASTRWQGASWRAQGQLQPNAQLRLALNADRPDPQLPLQLQLQAVGRLDALALQAQLQSAAQPLLSAQATLQALAAQPLRTLNARWQALDPQRLHPGAPKGRWDGSAELKPLPDGRLQLNLQTTNHAALRLDQQGWPLRSLLLRASGDPQQWQALQLEALSLELGSAHQAAGRLELAAAQTLPAPGAPLQTQLRLVGLLPHQLQRDWPTWPISGSLNLSQARDSAKASSPMQWALALSSSALPWRLQAEGSLLGQRLDLREAQLRQGDSLVRLSGWAEGQAQGWRSSGQAEASALLATLPPWQAPSLLSGLLRWELARDADGRHLGEIDLSLKDGSQLAGLPLSGQARFAPGAQAAPWQLALSSAGAQLQVQGDLGKALRDLGALRQASAWQPQSLQWQAKDLAALAPLWRPWLKQLAGSSSGSWTAADAQLKAELDQLVLELPDQPLLSLRSAAVQWQAGRGQLQLSDLRRAGLRVKQAQAEGGTLAALSWRADGELQAANGNLQTWRSEGRSQAPEPLADGGWRWPALQASAGPGDDTLWLQLAPTALRWQSGQLSLEPGSLLVAGQALNLKQAQWQAAGSGWAFELDGRLRWQPLLRLLDPPGAWQGDASSALRMRAVQQAEPAQALLDLQVDDLAGALQLDGQPLDLQTLALSLQRQSDGSARLVASLRSALLGEVDAKLDQSAGAAGALSGTVLARLPRLEALRPWLPGGLQLQGQARVDARLSGTRGAPRLQGNANLALTRLQHPASGLGGQQGLLRAEFDDQRLRITELSLNGSGEQGGRLEGSGEMDWSQGRPRARLQLKAQALRVLSRFDRRLVLSGQTQLQLDAKQLKLNGELRADEGLFEIGQSDAPQLDDDVRIAGPSAPQAAAPPASRWQREVDLRLNLGERLRVQGRGFASRLTGQLRWQESGGKPGQLTGSIETQGGRYKAYGQTLDIESGELRFTGSPGNPRLALVAIRPNIEHRVGVSVTGSLEAPRIRLMAEPELPDNDKLAWLLLGRDPATLAARDTALLQRAALALLAGEGQNTAGELLDRLGLTEFSVSQGEDAGTVLRLGAQLSKRWSVGYERSLNATAGSWQLVYRLGQRFRLRAQSGVESALDLLWLWRYD